MITPCLPLYSLQENVSLLKNLSVPQICFHSVLCIALRLLTDCSKLFFGNPIHKICDLEMSVYGYEVIIHPDYAFLNLSWFFIRISSEFSKFKSLTTLQLLT